MSPVHEPVTIRLVEPGDDAELKAMSYILSVLENFTDDERGRILTWLYERTNSLKRGRAK